ncbi:MAG: hypothetical protein IKA79_03690 [Lentisphaeria bacterium]|nr:hypothetical protein [Lentisphaeria bacterium]
MSNAKNRKKFTACGDKEAENLLKRVLLEMKETLSGTDLCVVLGGGYGRGDGGVRQDKENGILYNDLDFFVFASNVPARGEELLKDIAEKYEKELKVDMDFSRVMTGRDIKNNERRLMMQELKRGYHLVCGEDFPAKYLKERPARELPFSEACRLLFNRGMGLLLAGEKISNNSSDTDFILRNIYKAVLGAVDAILISSGKYYWHIGQRLKFVEDSEYPELWKELYREAVAFKHAPHRKMKEDMVSFWNNVRDFFQSAVILSAGDCNFPEGIYRRCRAGKEASFKNYVKYCIKSRSLPLLTWKYYTVPAAAVLLSDVFAELENMPEKLEKKSKLYRMWRIFN